MKKVLLLLTFLVSVNALGSEIFFKVEDVRGGWVTMTTTMTKQKGYFYLSQEDWNIHLIYSKEMFKTEYSAMTDEQMNKIISKKLKRTSKQLKALYIKGMVIENAIKKLNIK